ncbi:RsiW-degrading membrane proteinase PrsW (M82 family) [Halohasta litchfieldiae]|jgi:RsiW-degrading membrane proteinase PrsW (M82 family)|uniref:Membrane proteinase PrsW, cleaves anti-sigma factor RsiW, M82 family n=1 Tax=Halohasta litchfieldiae TaxID=1073996 RepID=A0A1H6XAP8_9EURY|nr:PrsW family intramembrane metalloprotease [Halohasta litchfieldiae]ATW87470.1 RsiW-degrading membrane proteinase PrsW (M82 family) [Halohasta litchfieldiae]SEJ26208.1 Membrane proteinase PrsW, cleaves anti-sigma factor RsiW, M82 family [Halohasta litchfieldiae]
MSDQRDPVESAADESRDLYDVATWEERTSVDGVAVALYWLLTRTAKWFVILLALGILVAIGGLAAFTDPAIGLLTLLSVIPALGLTIYVYRSDVTTREPLSLLVTTFILSILFATFAAVINTYARDLFAPLGFVGLILFYFLIVGPGEETVKLLAVRLYAYNDDRFDSVVDGAVYGAISGLGFATIENALYIVTQLEEAGELAELSIGFGAILAGGDITAVRALAGPGHVIYSAIAGYYLGLAKFNPENRGPIIVKGLLLAALIHATYNSTVGIGSYIISLSGLPQLASFFVFVIIFDGIFGLFLLRKIWTYRSEYRAVDAGKQAQSAELADGGPNEP